MSHNIPNSTAITKITQRSDFELTTPHRDTPYLTITSNLWGVHWAYLEKIDTSHNWDPFHKRFHELLIEMLWNYALLLHDNIQTINQVTIFHMPWQLSCQGMRKIVYSESNCDEKNSQLRAHKPFVKWIWRLLYVVWYINLLSQELACDGPMESL